MITIPDGETALFTRNGGTELEYQIGVGRDEYATELTMFLLGCFARAESDPCWFLDMVEWAEDEIDAFKAQ